jgi:hypothetical protein
MKKRSSVWQQGIRIGLVGGIVEVLLALVGMVEAFSQRYMISDVISMGQTLLLVIAMFTGYLAAKRTDRLKPFRVLVNSLVSGLMVGGLMSLLVMVGSRVRLRAVFINASPGLYNLLTLNQGVETGVILLLIFGTLSSLLSGLLYFSPSLLRHVLITSLSGIAMAGLLQDLVRAILAAWGPIAEINQWFFTVNGLTVRGAVSLFILITVVSYFLMKI